MTIKFFVSTDNGTVSNSTQSSFGVWKISGKEHWKLSNFEIIWSTLQKNSFIRILKSYRCIQYLKRYQNGGVYIST